MDDNEDQVLTTLCVSAVALLIQYERATLHIRQRNSLWATSHSLTDAEFRRSFRLHRRDFADLVSRVRILITKDEKTGRLRNGAVEVCVAVVLRIMSGAAYLDMLTLWGLGKSSVFSMFHATAEALIKVLDCHDLQRRTGTVNDYSCVKTLLT